MEISEIQQLIQAGLPGAEVQIDGDGSHFNAHIIYERFEGKTLIKQHQMVYATLGEHFQTNAIHALSLKTYTPEQWKKVIK
jgi:acid stress-induced BolA-like protein IbaG/YrbA